MDKKRLYKIAYRIIGDRTPLPFDCGFLCSKACCKGTNDSGMLLYPGEENLYTSNKWYEIKDSNIFLSDGTNIKLLVCNGNCIRAQRPLMCRIFPLVPYISNDNKLSVKMDLRGLSICPLVKFLGPKKINPVFKRKVRDVSHLLNKDTQISEFIKIISRQIDDLELFWGSPTSKQLKKSEEARHNQKQGKQSQ